jgi:hypothetical protein
MVIWSGAGIFFETTAMRRSLQVEPVRRQKAVAPR